MSDTTFTPGPWKTDPLGIGTVGDVCESDGTQVAYAQPRKGRLPDPERDANTRLIASAPEMYALLDMIAKETDRMGHAGVLGMLYRALDEWDALRAKINEVKP